MSIETGKSLILADPEPKIITYTSTRECYVEFTFRNIDGKLYTVKAAGIYRMVEADPAAQVQLWKACTVCGNSTPLACADCFMDGITENVDSIHVCAKPECQCKHEETCPGRKHHV